MSLTDQLAAVRDTFGGIDGLDLTPFDNLTNTFGDVEAGFQVRLAEKDEMIQAMEAEISRLKSINYDLMMAAAPAPEAAPIDGDGDGEVDADGDGDEDEESEGRKTVDSMLD